MKRYPVKRFVIVGLICIYALLTASRLFADNRTQNIDMFLVVDKSLSMAPKIGAVKQYIDKSIIQGTLIPGDHLVVIDFWGQARVLLSTTVGTNKQPIEKVINSIQANGHWTDIGNALDVLQRVIKAGHYPERRKYFMLITDGIQDAPPTSAYYSPNGSFNSAFLKNTKTIQKKGWKVVILGIGTETAAAKLAKSLSGGYVSVSNHPSTKELQQKLQGLIGVIEAKGLSVTRIGTGGTGILHVTLTSTGYSEAKTVHISDVRLEVPGMPVEDIAQPESIVIAPKQTKHVSIPITVSHLNPGSYDAKVVFTFSGNSSFSPAVFTTKVRVNGFVRNHVGYVAGAAVLVLLLILLAIFLISRSARGRKVAFVFTIEGDLKQSNTFVLKSGNRLLVQDTPMGFRPVAREIANPVAGITFDGTGLRLEILNSSRIEGQDIPSNALGRRVHLKTNAGKDLFFQFDRS